MTLKKIIIYLALLIAGFSVGGGLGHSLGLKKGRKEVRFIDLSGSPNIIHVDSMSMDNIQFRIPEANNDSFDFKANYLFQRVL